MTNINSNKLKQLQAELEHIYQEGLPINEMGDRVDLNQQVRPRLSLNKILEWVESLPPETVVGYTVAASDCPVYHYLKDCGFKPTLITCGSIRGKGFVFTSSNLSERMPTAVSKLISLVDKQGPGGTPITAQMLTELIQQSQKEAEVAKNNQNPKLSDSLERSGNHLAEAAALLDKIKARLAEREKESGK